MEQRKEYYRDPLTNEKIIQKFESQFDLVNYAIRLAENMIHSGRDARVKLDCENREVDSSMKQGFQSRLSNRAQLHWPLPHFDSSAYLRS